MFLSNNRGCASICCNQDQANPPGPMCYWNVSLYTAQPSIPRIITNESLTWSDRKTFVPGVSVPCLTKTVCSSFCVVGHDLPAYLAGNGTVPMNDSMDGLLTCRYEDREYCFKQYRIGKADSVMSVCQTFFDFEETLQMVMEAVDHEIPATIYPLIISLLFFVITFIIYTVVPELRNLHGLILRSYLACVFGFFLSLVLYLGFIRNCNPFLAFSLHLTMLATFFWLNVMAFDIWWTFRSMRDSAKQSPVKKYIIYSAYAWGIPILIIAFAVVMDFIPGAPAAMKPGLNNDNCWLSERSAITYYMQVPMTMTVAGNLCFFVLTALNIIRQKKATAESLEGNDSRRYNDEKQRYDLYLKLSIIMGMTWLAIVIPGLGQMHISSCVAWILQLPNYLQGPIIFKFFVWNDRTKGLVAKRLGIKDRPLIEWTELAIVRLRAVGRQPRAS